MSTDLAPYAPPPTPAAPMAHSLDFGQMQTLAESVAKSGMFAGINTVDKALTLMMLCESEGIHPAQAMRRFHIIKNTPSMRADAMLAEFQAKGGRVEWHRFDAAEAAATFYHAAGAPKGLRLAITLDELKTSGVAMIWRDDPKHPDRGYWDVKDMYRTNPAAMLRARLVSAAVRMILPGIVVGIHTPEEIADGVLDALEAPASTPPPPAALEAPPTPTEPIRGDIVPPRKDQPVKTQGQAADDWPSYFRELKRRSDDAFDNELGIAGIKPEKRRSLRKPIEHISHAVNHLVSAAIEAGALAPEHVAKADKPDKRDPELAKEAAADLYRSRRRWVRDTVNTWAATKLAEALQAAGIAPPPEDESQEPPQAAGDDSQEPPDEGPPIDPPDYDGSDIPY